MASASAASRARAWRRGRRSWRTGRGRMRRRETVDPARRRVLGAGVAGAVLTGLPGVSFARGAPIVRTTAGRVRGRFDGELQVFRVIRYGADTAARRFEPPVPPAP